MSGKGVEEMEVAFQAEGSFRGCRAIEVASGFVWETAAILNGQQA